MVIHTDTLNIGHLHAATPPGIFVRDGIERHGSRTHARKFTHVRLESNRARRFPNTGTHGADRATRAATWDEHGQWMAALLAIDPNARIIGAADYRGREDFHAQTEGRYV